MTTVRESEDYRGHRIRILVQDSLLPWHDRYVCVVAYINGKKREVWASRCSTDELEGRVESLYEDARVFIDSRCEKQNHDRRAIERALEGWYVRGV